MNEKQTVLYFDNMNYEKAQRNIKQAVKTCNSAIFQFADTLEIPINNVEEAEQYLSNPLQYFDSELIKKLKFDSGNPNCELLATLHNVNREGFIQSVYGKQPVKKCSICSETDSLPSIAPCTAQFNANKRYFLWNDQTQEFEVNADLIEIELRPKFETLATDEMQKKLDFLNNFVEMINKALKAGLIAHSTCRELEKNGFLFAPNVMQIALPINLGIILNNVKL